MRIFLLINSLGTGGAEFSTLKLYSWLKHEAEVEIKIICLKKSNPEYSSKDFESNELVYLSGNSFVSKLKQFNNILENEKPQIVHSVLFEANLLGRVSKVLKRNFIHVESLVNQTYSPYRLEDPNINFFKLETFRYLDMLTQYFGVDHYHSNGATVARHYMDKLLINSKRITNIPRGREVNSYYKNSEIIKTVRKSFNVKDQVLLINVARHEYQKAQTVLLEALSLLPELTVKFKLLLVGRTGESTNLIKDQIQKFKLNEMVEILGHRTDVPKLLAASDIFVFPSRFEGLPGALIEAEAAGLPIICSNIPNNLEVVEENKNALIFPVDCPIDLSKKLHQLISNAVMRKSMGEESLIIFNNKFTIENVHHKMFNMFQQLVSLQDGNK